jgi:branched-chain amino acid transport system permease protein
MATLLSVFVLGLSLGLILFLLAAGMTLTMGLMRIVNMSHGALYMVGGYVGIGVANWTHNFWLAMLAGAVVTGLIGIGLEVGFLRRLYNDEASQVLLTIGFIYILQNLTQWIWGTYPLGAPVPKLLSAAVPVGSIELPAYRFFLIAFGFLMAFLLWWFQDRTKVGSWVRAGMDNREITGTFGINLKLLFTGIFALGSLIAGMCGVLGAPVTGMNLGIGWGALLLALIVVVIGGTGSIQGALIGGIIIGLLNAFGGAYFPEFADYVVYVALIVILLVRPSGLLGRKHDARTGENLEKASTAKVGDSPFAAASSKGAHRAGGRIIAYRFLPYVMALVALLVLPQVVTPYYQDMLTKVLIFAIFAMSLDLVMGFTGLISFGWAAFFGMSGYSVGILTVHYGWSSFWLVLVVSLLITAGLAAGIGYLSLRVSGVYFLLVTMAFAQLLAIVATKWYSMTGGRDGLFGIPKPDLGFMEVDWTNLNYYYFVLIGFVICYFILNRIAHSSFGRTLVGIRANEPRMRSLGYNTWALKYMALIIGGVFAGVAGALFAFDYGTMTPDYFALETSALPMLMVIIGGAASLWGPSLGAAAIIVAESVAGIYFEDRWPLVLGIIFVACVMLLKGGFARHLTRLWDVMWGVGRPRSMMGVDARHPAAKEDLPSSVGKEVET